MVPDGHHSPDPLPPGDHPGSVAPTMPHNEISESVDGPEPYTTHHDLDDHDDLSVSVVMAVADAAGVDSSELEDQLDSVVDPDALDDIFQSTMDGTPRTGGSVSFAINGYAVRVWSDGSIVVTPGRRPE